MTESILGGLCFVQAAVLVFVLRQAGAERARLLNAAMAKTPQEFVVLEKAATKPRKTKSDDEGQWAPVGL